MASSSVYHRQPSNLSSASSEASEWSSMHKFTDLPSDLPTECHCRNPAHTLIRTSWTDWNPGRRFMTCENKVPKSQKCKFFLWVDKPLCRRGQLIVPGLLRKVRIMDAENVVMERKIKALWAVVIILLLVVIWMLLF